MTAREPHGDVDLRDEPVEPEILESEVVYHGLVWDIRRERFRMSGSQPVREFVAHPGAVAVLALDDADRVMLIRQYRHPIRTREWELPAGLLDVPGEEPVLAAQRELAEEADLAARAWEPLIRFPTSPGGSDEVIHVFLATGTHAVDTDFVRTDEEAELETRWVPFDEVVAAALAGRIGNAILLVAVLALHARRS